MTTNNKKVKKCKKSEKITQTKKNKMTKKEIIGNKVQEIEEFVIAKNSELSLNIQDFRKIYKIEDICGLVEKFLIPIYEKNNNLQEYLNDELIRYNMVAGYIGLPQIEKVSDEDIKFLSDKIIEIIKIIQK